MRGSGAATMDAGSQISSPSEQGKTQAKIVEADKDHGDTSDHRQRFAARDAAHHAQTDVPRKKQVKKNSAWNRLAD